MKNLIAAASTYGRAKISWYLDVSKLEFIVAPSPTLNSLVSYALVTYLVRKN